LWARHRIQLAVMFGPGARHEEEHGENNETLFRGRENKNGEQPFHLPA
jgi:hypothetical protein